VEAVLPVAVLIGIALELVKYLFLFALAWLDRKFQTNMARSLCSFDCGFQW